MKTDQQWFDKYIAIVDYSELDFFSLDKSDNEKLRAMFLADKGFSPNFTYKLIKTFNIDDKSKKLQALDDDIRSTEENESIKYLYEKKIKEQLEVLNLISACKTEDDILFKEKTESLYGKPRVGMLERVMPSFKWLVESVSNNVDLQESAEFLSNYILSGSLSTPDIELNSSEVVENLLGSNEIKNAFSKVIQEQGFADWESVVDGESKNTHIRIDAQKKKIIVPKNRKVGSKRLDALIEHEINIHLLRNRNGNSTSLALLSVGFDHYIIADEGLGVYSQYQLDPLGLVGSVELYLGLSVVYGLIGKQGSFREVYDFYTHYYIVSRKVTSAGGMKDAANYAWGRCVKLFRGTTAQTRGVAYTRSLVYLEGYFMIKELIDSGKMTKEQLMVGKFNPFDNNHNQSLRDLEVLF